MLLGLILFISLMGVTLGGRLPLTWPEKFVHDTVTFIQQIFYRPASYVSNFVKDVSNLKELHDENEQLRMMLAQYTRDQAFYNEIKAENERLQSKLQFTENQKQQNMPYKYRIAQVTSINVADPFNRNLNLNLGSKNGVRQGMPVISEDGVVGIVSRVFEFSSTVQLLTNMDEKNLNLSAIAATVAGKENKSFGMIESYDHSSGKFLMTRIKEDDELKEGDTIVSSGIGGSFPRGLVIGRVVSRQIGDVGLTYSALVEPAATYHNCHELFVVITPDSNEAGKEAQ